MRNLHPRQMKQLPRFTFGMGDRFGRQGEAQLRSVLDARALGMDVAPVWNKSKREHTLIGTEPQSLRNEADAAVRALDYDGPYFVDADHITIETVDDFIACSDFFTLDIADSLGKPPRSVDNADRYRQTLEALGSVSVEGMETVSFDPESASALLEAYGAAIEAAKALYEKIAAARPDGDFAVEISMDETETPQGPKELLGILRLLALENIPAQTIAPKFTGRFNKGVDYVGDLEQFTVEFESDVLVLAYAIKNFGLPSSLKLSVHSGSDKFSLYPIIKDIVTKHNAGLHMKTAGTTWLEEVIGLAEAGGAGFDFVKELYIDALDHYDALTAPYSTVLYIDRSQLPSVKVARGWKSEDLVAMVEHDQENPLFNSSLRQFFHVAFKLASKAGDGYYSLLDENAGIINRRVHHNLFQRHILKVFPE
ncbi:tagaturonate epimerase family protein [Oceanipulchritudo coccoides]|nr:tagaturonate epimerase family protein [Oceanipulchritudo coccoides]